jgi:phytoene desaturase
MSTKAIVLGAGISGLSAAAYLAKHGFNVEVLEKNSSPGGRARILESEGFVFDMGPSWYWMPDVFIKFFGHFDHQPSDFYNLKRLDPSYRVFFKDNEIVDVPAKSKELYHLFEQLEPGSSKNLKRFLNDAYKKYRLGMDIAVQKPSLSFTEFIDPKLITGFLLSKSFRSLSSHVRSMFKDPRIIQILEFPVLFLGSMPQNIPALYSLMNYADLKLGSWYPMGGFGKVVDAMVKLCHKLDVELTYNVDVSQLDVLKNRVIAAHAGHRNFYGEYFVSSVDYNFTEQKLLREKYRNYTENYWESKVMAPSALLYYIGVDKKIPNLLHHNLLFDTDFSKHAHEIYKTPKWPESPAMYISVSSKTDPSTAPKGQENLVVLIPVAPGLEDHGKVREYYFDMAIKKIEKISGTKIRDNIVYHKSYAHSDFIADYNSFKGNAYGLANTLRQTGPLKPKIKNKQLPNLFYTGQLTVPGPGVPPSLISGKIVADLVFKASGGHKS